MESPSARRHQTDVVKLFPRPCFFLLRWQEETTHLQNHVSATERAASFEISGVEADGSKGQGSGPAWEYGTNPNVGLGERDGISVT